MTSSRSSRVRAAIEHHPWGNVQFAVLLALAFALAFPLAAVADEGDGNVVDPTQRADNSFIYDTTIESLFEQASLYDDRTVQVVGEVVGDRISTNDGTGNCWVTLTSMDEANASSISVLLSAEQANQIDQFGRYGVTGTTLQVRGTYHQACGEHDGLPDIHATNSSVLAKGVEHLDSFSLGDFAPGLIAVVIGLALMGVFYFARERMR
ncbi:MAG: hydrolase [Eggerthellaceae bacterium]|nr:hydrolase [Eggerthellaceae bacterium]